MSRETLNELLQIYISMGVRDFELESKIKRALQRLNLNIPGLVEPDIAFAEKLLHLFENNLNTCAKSFLEKEKCRLTYIKRRTSYFFVEDNKIDKEKLHKHCQDDDETYIYNFSLENLYLSRDHILSKHELIFYKSADNSEVNIEILDRLYPDYQFDEGDAPIRYESIDYEKLMTPSSIDNLLVNLRNITILDLSTDYEKYDLFDYDILEKIEEEDSSLSMEQNPHD